MWHIQSVTESYIHLLFDSFDIGCDSQSSLEIEQTAGKRSTFCNTNKPVQGIKSLTGYLKIRFTLNRIANFLIEGFSGRYEMLYKDLSLESMISEKGMGGYTFFFYN